MEKTCFKCSKTLPLAEFYKHKMMGDGHLNKCKECTKADVNRRYENEREKIAAYERKRAKTEHRKALVLEYQRKMRHADPEKARVRSATSRYIRNGRIPREPCKMCGTTEKVQAHHYSYESPFTIEWLCFKCHREHAHGQTVNPPPRPCPS